MALYYVWGVVFESIPAVPGVVSATSFNTGPAILGRAFAELRLSTGQTVLAHPSWVLVDRTKFVSSGLIATMHQILPRLRQVPFQALDRGIIETLQVNVGYRCNQACVHCHVDAGPKRTEEMGAEVAELVLTYLSRSSASCLDITGGAPELNGEFRRLVTGARAQGAKVIDRCNLTILEEPGFEDLAAFLAENNVVIIASLPCYQQENVDRQRGKGVYASSISALKKLNSYGYGMDGTDLELHLVYNPQGPSLPPAQDALQALYKSRLRDDCDVHFNNLYTLCNMPIKRFASSLVATDQFDGYLDLLRAAHDDNNVEHLMCRSLLSIDWQGYVYDCDFNQMLDLPLKFGESPRQHLRDLIDIDLAGNPIIVAGHCYGCSAGQGSSCGGALG